jgi:hypothetical protein
VLVPDSVAAERCYRGTQDVPSIQHHKSSPEESQRWNAYLARRKAAICSGTPLQQGIRLALLPSAAAQRSWTVQQHASHNALPAAQHVVCEVGDDYQRFLDADPDGQATLEPRINRTTVELPLDAHAEITALISSVVAPLSMTSSPLGTDGTSYLLEKRCGLNRLLLEWWHTAPHDWRAIAAVFERAWQTLDRVAGVTQQTP